MNYIIIALVSSILLSVSDICSKYALINNVSTVNLIFWSHGVTYIVCLSLLILLCRYLPLKFLVDIQPKSFYEIIKLNKNLKVNIAMIFSGLLAFIALIGIIYAFKITDNIGYTVGLISTTCLFTLIISFFYLKTQIEKKGILGCIFIILGIVLISNCSNNMRV